MQRVFSLPVAVVAPRLSPNSVRRVRQAKNPLHYAKIYIAPLSGSIWAEIADDFATKFAHINRMLRFWAQGLKMRRR